MLLSTPSPERSRSGGTGAELVEITARSDEVTVTVEDRPAEEPNTQTECVICLGELEGEEEVTRTLTCGHRFHTACVSEWLSKDGRCPTCRCQIQEVTRARTPEMIPTEANLASMHSMAILMLESRRLMMLATMEAALAVLVMSYVADLLSPLLMIVAAAVTFLGASHYLSRSIGAARPILAINGLYHVYIIAGIVHSQQGIAFFSEEYGTARTILLSLGCVTVMEVATLKKASSFHTRLARAPPAELRTLRTSRRAHVGWAQRLIVLVMFVLICAPVIARYVCGAGRGDGSGGVCDR